MNVSETNEQGNIKVTLTNFAVGPGISIYTSSPVILSSGGFIFLNTSLRPCSADEVHRLAFLLCEIVDRQGFGRMCGRPSEMTLVHLP